MAQLFNIRHETGDLTEWSSTSTGGGDLSVTAAAALGGSYGMAILINDTATKYADKNVSAPASGKLRYRFYFDPNSLTMAGGDSFYISRVYIVGAPFYMLLVRLRKNGAVLELGATAYNDAGVVSTQSLTISDAPHYAEFSFVRASSNVASDGSLQMWVDGADFYTWAALDNYDAFAVLQIISLEASGLDAGTSGTIYLDELQANDDGAAIGPVVSLAVWRRTAGEGA